MAKSFNVDIKSFNTTNDMDSVYAGNDLTEIVTEPTPKPTPAGTKEKKENIKSNVDHTKTTDAKGRINKTNNYAITIKIDEDLREYLSKIDWIKMLSERESTNKNQYINDLIRADMINRLNLSKDAGYDEIQKAWENFKKINKI